MIFITSPNILPINNFTLGESTMLLWIIKI